MPATFPRIKTWIAGEVLTAADLNAEFSNILTNFTFAGMDDYSANNPEVRTQTAPFPGSALSLATTGQGELERLRYQIAQITGNTYWYQAPATDIATLNTNYGAVVNRFAYGTTWIPAGAMIPQVTSGAVGGTHEYVANDIMLDYYAFAKGSIKYVAFNLVMSENWDLGTVKAKFFWSSATGSSIADTVEWGIAGGAFSNSDAIDAAVVGWQVMSDAVLADNGTALQVSAATPAITISGTPALNDLVHFKVIRNVGGTDNMTEDAWLFGVLIQYTISENVVTW